MAGMLHRLRTMLAHVFRRDAADRAMADEFDLHVDLVAEDLVRRGVPRDEAVRQARLAFGNLTVTKEDARATTGLAWLDTLGQDVRFTLRTLRKNAGFTAVAVLSLGFGIGASTTMFSVIDTLDFRPLPYANADRLVWLAEVSPPDDDECARCAFPTTLATARDWLAGTRSYNALVVTTDAGITWAHDDIDESVGAGATTPGILDLFGLRPVLGRDLAASDTLPGADPVALLTYDFWEARFGRDPAVIGAQLRARLGGPTSPLRTMTIVGVAPKSFRIMPEHKLWSATSLRGGTSRVARRATVIARLAPGASVGGATAELEAVSAGIARAYPTEFRGWTARVEPLRERLGWVAGQGRGVLFGTTLAVLLIAVLNVTGLLFGRGAARSAEFAMRAALGASRARLLRQLLVEGTCIGLLGGLTGVGIALAGVRVAAQRFSVQAAGLDVGVDGRMLAFAAALSLIVGLAAAVAPAVRTSRMDTSSNLRPRVTGGSRAARASSVLITAQIALAFMLLSVATLLSRDFLQLRYFDLGYDPRGLFGTSLSTQGPEWLHPDPWKSVVAETRARVAAIPGIESASLDYESAIHPSVVHSDRVAESQLDRNPRVKAVSPDYFKTWKNPVLLGRAFAATDRAGAPLVAIVNRACASAFWPGMNPLGRRVFLGDSASGGEWLTVVGVTEDVEGGYYRFRHGLVVYRPFEQARLYHASVTLYVRPVGDRPAPLASVQSVIRQVTGQRGAPFVNEDERIDTRYRPRRFNAIALDVFAGFGLLLAAMGIYGSIAFAVAQRTREIGIRVALGAERSNVLSLVARRGVIIAAVGASLGVAGSVALTRVFRSFVSATNAGNPWIVGASVVVVVVVALIATFLPARRATDVSPVIALRAD